MAPAHTIMTGDTAIVDPDDPTTWPDEVRAWVDRWGEQRIEDALGGSWVAVREEDGFRELLRGRRLLAYHSTCLLEHEADAIKRDGLDPVSAELIGKRLDAAFERGHLSDLERQALRRAHIFARNDRADPVERRLLEARELGVYLLAGRGCFNDPHVDMVEWLSTWGGPALYEGVTRWPEPDPLAETLRRLGWPSIVVTALEVTNEGFRRPTIVEPLGLVFSLVALGNTDLEHATEICYSAPISATNIL
jgi:hypothetical protein